MVEQDIDEGRFSPQNEIDFTGYLFHIWLSHYQEDRKYLHLEARVNNYKQSEGGYRGHADLAYGETGISPKRRQWIKRPDIIVESKSFRGFTPDQKALRRKRLKNDIKTLGKAQLEGKVVRVAIVLDDKEKRLDPRYVGSIQTRQEAEDTPVHNR